MKIDYSMILKQCGGDKGLVKEVISILTKETPRYLKEINQALTINDFKKIAGIAHTLKGSVANFGVGEVSDSIIALEKAAIAGDKEIITAKFNVMSEYLSELISELQNLDSLNNLE